MMRFAVGRLSGALLTLVMVSMVVEGAGEGPALPGPAGDADAQPMDGFKMQDPVVGRNPKLRKAVAHAINHAALVRLVTERLAIEARVFFPTAVIPLPPSAYPYDVSAAKRMLAEPGFPQVSDCNCALPRSDA